MKQLSICAVVAAVVSVAILWIEDAVERDAGEAATAAAPTGPSTDATADSPLRYSDALVEDAWVDAARQAGSDRRTLTSASTSICYLTKIEISGVQGPDDTSSCAIEVDDFTGFWQVIATADEGGRSEIRCNARCLSWQTDGVEQ